MHRILIPIIVPAYLNAWDFYGTASRRLRLLRCHPPNPSVSAAPVSYFLAFLLHSPALAAVSPHEQDIE